MGLGAQDLGTMEDKSLPELSFSGGLGDTYFSGMDRRHPPLSTSLF